MFWNNFLKSSKLIAAHRGARSIRAENTMSAFEASLNKADFIELDVGFTKDGVAVIVHDETLKRTSDVINHKIFKSPYKVIDYTYKEILQLDFSSWFIKKDPFNTIKDRIITIEELNNIDTQRVLTLEEILIFCKKNNFPLNIEIKDMSGTKFDNIAVSKIANIVKKLKVEDLVLFSSFNHTYLKQLAILAPNITRAALQEKEHPKDILRYLRDLKVDVYHCDVNIFTKQIADELNKNGFFVNVYTVNNRQEKQKLFAQGVKAIFTDYL